MNGGSTSFDQGTIFQVEVLSETGGMWVDMGEHSTLTMARGAVERLRAPLTRDQKLNGMRSMEGRKFRIRRFVVAEIIDVPSDADAPEAVPS